MMISVASAARREIQLGIACKERDDCRPTHQSEKQNGEKAAQGYILRLGTCPGQRLGGTKASTFDRSAAANCRRLANAEGSESLRSLIELEQNLMIPPTDMRHNLTSAWLLAALAAFVGPASLAGQGTEARARQVEARFVSPCCWRENLAVHDSQVAEQLRALIAEMVQSGRTEPQIVDYMVARFGERVLREPRGTPFRLLNLIPLMALMIGFLFVVRFLLRARALAMWECNRVPLAQPDEDLEWI